MITDTISKQTFKKQFGLANSFSYFDKSKDLVKIQNLIKKEIAKDADNIFDYVEPASEVDQVILVNIKDKNIKYHAKIYLSNNKILKISI